MAHFLGSLELFNVRSSSTFLVVSSESALLLSLSSTSLGDAWSMSMESGKVLAQAGRVRRVMEIRRTKRRIHVVEGNLQRAELRDENMFVCRLVPWQKPEN